MAEEEGGWRWQRWVYNYLKDSQQPQISAMCCGSAARDQSALGVLGFAEPTRNSHGVRAAAYVLLGCFIRTKQILCFLLKYQFAVVNCEQHNPSFKALAKRAGAQTRWISGIYFPYSNTWNHFVPSWHRPHAEALRNNHYAKIRHLWGKSGKILPNSSTYLNNWLKK